MKLIPYINVNKDVSSSLLSIGGLEGCDASVSLRVVQLTPEQQQKEVECGVYEGGMKVWECTKDMLRLLVTLNDRGELPSGKALDLGCGHGLLGVYLLCVCGVCVDFQDMNASVLSDITSYNIAINTHTHTHTSLQL
eukprot:GHVR01159976.1.p1 GENE.GHVR01159976.1~~GHVR01159976.1.p1  ORF type:complete len:137 (+),score=58.38 GHVR01159976.1:277-687(+)